MKEQEHSPEEQNATEIGNISDVEFRIMMAKMLNSTRKDMVTTEKDQSEIKNDRALIKNTLKGTHSRLGEAGDRISESERTSALVWAFAWELALSPASPSNRASVYSPRSVLSTVDKLPPHRNAHMCTRVCVCGRVPAAKASCQLRAPWKSWL